MAWLFLMAISKRFSASFMLALVALSRAASAQTGPSPSQLIPAADSLATASQNDDAEVLYARAILSSHDSLTLAAAKFGLAYTRQIRLTKTPDSLRDALADSVLNDYRTAAALD